MQRTVSLVLGSGGARGLAHIGIIRRLEDLDYRIVSISGCSIGALIGAFYAANRLDTYANWVQTLDAFDIVKLLDIDGEGGMVRGAKLMRRLEMLLGGDQTIESLPIRYHAVATDIDEQKEVWIGRGSLLEAVRASIAIPMLFEPVRKNGMRLVDGGVLNPVPIAPTFSDQSDLIIAVNLGGEATPTPPLPEPTIDELEFSDKIKAYLSKWAFKNSLFQNETFDVAARSFDAMQANLSRVKLAAYPPDVEIGIPRNLCKMLEFHRAKEIIAYGYEIAAKYL